MDVEHLREIYAYVKTIYYTNPENSTSPECTIIKWT